jgi:magnesium chelatase family protein
MATQRCNCGFYGDPTNECRCTPPQIQRYIAKISGPLLDRIDIHINVPAVKLSELSAQESGEGSVEIRGRVVRARKLQQQRFAGEGTFSNAQMAPRLIRKHCHLDLSSQQMLERAMMKFGLSARAYDRILKVSRTIADLAGVERITEEHLAEAIQYRTLDRNFWK